MQQINLQIRKGQFWAIIGRSGCGKSTLLRALGRLVPDFYGGTLSGEILLKGRLLREWNAGKLYREMGVIIQDPEHSIIFDTVQRDIAFGLENLGLDNVEMRKRIARILDYFSLNELSHKSDSHLTGGEKQKVAKAGILAMQPQILILDEPTAQLDPDAACDFMELIKRLHKEAGMTVIMAEQKLEMLFEMADKTAVMEKGEIIFSGTPLEQMQWAKKNNYPLVPERVKERTAHVNKKSYLLPPTEEKNVTAAGYNKEPYSRPLTANRDVVAAVQGVCFYYEAGITALKDIDLTLHRGEITALAGDNGAGKTTLLKILLGLLKPEQGQVKVLGYQDGKLAPNLIGREAAYLPQNLDHFFIADTVLADVMLNIRKPGDIGDIAQLWLEKLNVIKYSDKDPRILSTGEKQRAALAAVLAGNPRLILLDEPTRGLDMIQKREFGQILRQLAAEGRAILLASHDMDFVREYTDRVLHMQQGQITADKNSAESTEAI